MVISNFYAIIFEYHQFLFQFWKEIGLSNLNFVTTTEGTYSFIERDFVLPTCFNA